MAWPSTKHHGDSHQMAREAMLFKFQKWLSVGICIYIHLFSLEYFSVCVYIYVYISIPFRGSSVYVYMHIYIRAEILRCFGHRLG